MELECHQLGEVEEVWQGSNRPSPLVLAPAAAPVPRTQMTMTQARLVLVPAPARAATQTKVDKFYDFFRLLGCIIIRCGSLIIEGYSSFIMSYLRQCCTGEIYRKPFITYLCTIILFCVSRDQIQESV